MQKLQIYTDGSCLGNPGPGGWGVVVTNKEKYAEFSGGEPNTTNNRMEMQAVIEALKWITENAQDRDVEIYSDSSLVVKSMTKGWKRKKNHDLWEQIDLLHEGLKITWHWVKGHAANPHNNRADELANQGAQKQPSNVDPKSSAQKSKTIICPHCGDTSGGLFGYLEDSDMIRVDCGSCGRYIKFAEHTDENLKKAKKRPLITNELLEQVVAVKQSQGQEVGKKELQALKSWTRKEAQKFLEDNQTLF